MLVCLHYFVGNLIYVGTGKTFLIKAIVKALRSRDKNVVVTASTGIAAVPIDGCTLHSVAGTGVPVVYLLY